MTGLLQRGDRLVVSELSRLGVDLRPLAGEHSQAQAAGRQILHGVDQVREVYLGLDGTGVPVRPTEVAGRRGKQPDGSAKTREVKLATVWTAEGRDAEGRPYLDPGSVSYNAAVESAAS